MMTWDARQTPFERDQAADGGATSAVAPLTGTGVLRQGRKDLAKVTYIVRTIHRRDPSTGEYLSLYGGRIDLVEGIAEASDWSQAEDLTLHLQTQQLRLGVLLSGKKSSYTLRGRSSLDHDRSK
jgi:hypothetical protein